MAEEDCGCRIYVGNLDQRITESTMIKMFSPFGKIVSEDFLWHTRGPKRGEPRGYAFIHYNTKEEAQWAKREMHGRMACGRPLVVRLASEKCPDDPTKPKNASIVLSGQQQLSRSAKIAAIKNKLKSLESEGVVGLKKPRLAEDAPPNHSSENINKGSA